MAPSALHPMSVIALRAPAQSYQPASRALRVCNPAAAREYAQLVASREAALPSVAAVG
jgi:hypothetical protein